MQISADYKLVISSALLNALTCYVQGYYYGAKVRGQYFKKEKLKKS